MPAKLQQTLLDTPRNRGAAARADIVGTQRALMRQSLYPVLYQINTRAWMTDLARSLRRPVSLDDVPESALDEWQDRGFEWIYLLSVWTTGAAGQRASRQSPEWRREFQETLHDLKDEDIAGSGFAIKAYTVSPALGGDGALARLRERMSRRGLRLMLDFVPNHTAVDNPWVTERPEVYVAGTEVEAARTPGNYIKLSGAHGDWLAAHGRDPYFPGWPDTLQLDYGEPATIEAMSGELSRIAERCDGVRCDMAMLILPEVFERTWGHRAIPFWPETIRRIRAHSPGFLFMAEVYWDLEWTMIQQGFDFAYDKRLYDRLRSGDARSVRGHLCAGLDYQKHLARFMENHDEPRALAAFPDYDRDAAAVITYLTPGLRFFHEGQFEGRKIRLSPHLVRRPDEPVNPHIFDFYERLIDVLKRDEVREGSWQLLDCAPAWDGNWTHECFIVSWWSDGAGRLLLVPVNYAGNSAQCHVRLPESRLNGRTAVLRDLIGTDCFVRNGDELTSKGLYLDMPAWGHQAFEVKIY
jgi:hypothetical protein